MDCFETAPAHTMLFNTGRGCQVLVNGFCSGLHWTGPPSLNCFCPAETVNPVLPPTWDWSCSYFIITDLDRHKHHNLSVQITPSVPCSLQHFESLWVRATVPVGFIVCTFWLKGALIRCCLPSYHMITVRYFTAENLHERFLYEPLERLLIT